MPSDIQVFVKWKDQTIFAGEDVECTITFKNVAETNVELHPGGPTSHHRQPSRATSTHSESLFSLKSPQKFFFSPHRRSYSTAAKKSSSHRLSSSVSSPLIGSHSFPPPSTPRNGSAVGGKHKRSVSILSIDSEGTGEPTPRTSSQFSHPRPLRRHGRAASLQVLPRRYEAYEDQSAIGGRSPVRSFPPTESSIHSSPGNPRIDIDGPNDTSRRGSNIYSPNRSIEPPRTPVRRPPLSPIEFKFPPSPAADTNSHLGVSTLTSPIEENPTAPRPNGKEMTALAAPGHLPQLTRIMSTSSLAGSHRSSGDYNSISDNSSETLQSEYTNYSTTVPRAPIASRHSRHVSSVESPGLSPCSQTLLMGYAQISASFTVDGSLIHQSIFEEVKRKGVVGGAGNAAGLPRGKPAASEEKSRKSGGFWGAFKWNAIEESLSGLLSNNELDGLRDMRGVSSSRSIPLLSTTQSLLFVDLRLAPGEEQSYSFSFTLPSGLPASHKGKAIKISYNLVIGTQRPSSRNELQRVNRISIPFRVFSGVNGQGDIMGHDLMSPYVLLRDEARVQKVGTNPAPVAKPKSISGPTWTSAPEFLSYVDDILEKASRNNSLHPPEAAAEHRASHDLATGRLSCKDAIDLAILRSNQALNSSRSPNRFEIARDGRRIAVVVLNRPSHRLGETIIATVNFADAALPCYALRATLESSERVAPALAIRSNASIRRATRKVHASYFENTLYATRVVFSPAIPVSATPTILTTGVNHEWELRFEFVTSNAHDGSAPSGSRLLEAVSGDERGRVMSALENLGCESFEIAIPITIYGETVRERLPEENEGYAI
ncbi:intracellular protein transport protein [Aspergillus japonicus CBS 114.51]|uniref:Intracellular protein transport protein n=2 Tax=Aspergillus TaxID=5052 RepID=A0A2V5HJL2_ASPV1|nr:intracellular protein transport protein [Aspergillus japonicus CBS 114.51]PYI24655.1 intracellular protein transport protein [Aspergillus violaceofuscus CBS 115571]RAH79540.1 intracellular protein transport protein [Aspergillus japonicus CBS 114.51]